MSQSNEVFRILCLDGGGIRGAFTAGVLKAIEEKELLGSDSIADRCDLIAGTSTGALIAIALAFEHKAKKIFDLYQPEESIEIFGDSKIYQKIYRSFKRLLFAPYLSFVTFGDCDH